VALRWLDPCVLGRYLSGVANDVFNGMEAIASCRLTMSYACAAQRQVVRSPDTVAAHHKWAAGRRYTIAACCECPVDRCYLVVVLQIPCPHVLLSFNVPPTTCLASARYRPCCVECWKIHCHTPFRENGNEASIRVSKMFKSHVQ
jgi:hypothetical protein